MKQAAVAGADELPRAELELRSQGRKWRWVVGASMIIALGSLVLGFGVDDHSFRAALASGRANPFDLYRFADGDSLDHLRRVREGILPWWSADHFRLHLLRPAASALFATDVALFGDRAALYHLHSLLWYGVLLCIVASLFRRVLPRSSALFSLAAFGWKNAHVQAYAYVSARHTLLAAVGVAAGLLALTAKTHPARKRLVAAASMTLALLASEAGLAGLAYWFCFELLAERSGAPRSMAGPPPDENAGPRRGGLSPASLVPVALGVVYLVAYHALGGGAEGGGGYHDPLREPGAFLSSFARHLPIALGDSLLGVPSELGIGRPLGVLAGAGIVITMLCAIGLAKTWASLAPAERSAIGWLVPGGLAGLLVGASGMPTGRVLLIPDFGLSIVLGVLLSAAFGRARRSGWKLLLGGLLAAAHLVIAPLLSLLSMARLFRVSRASERIAETTEIAEGTKRVFVIASDPYVFLYPHGVLADEGRRSCWSVLSAVRAPHVLTRISADTVEIAPAGGRWVNGPFETLFRDAGQPFSPGDTFRQCGAELRVLEVKDGHPIRIAVHDQRGLDGPAGAWLTWRDHRLRRLELPAVGESRAIEWEPGPLRIF